jgi:hypothetical protein
MFRCFSNCHLQTFYQTIKEKKVKVTLYRPPRAQRGSRGIALLFHDLGTRRVWVVSTTPRPLHPRERPYTNCTGGWVCPRAGLDVCEKSRPTGIRFPDRPARSQSLHLLSYPAPYQTISTLEHYGTPLV